MSAAVYSLVAVVSLALLAFCLWAERRHLSPDG